MWQYEKKLLRPVKIERSDPTSAKIIASQLGGPHGNKLSSFTQKKRDGSFPPLFFYPYDFQFKKARFFKLNHKNDPPAAAPIKKFHSKF